MYSFDYVANLVVIGNSHGEEQPDTMDDLIAGGPLQTSVDPVTESTFDHPSIVSRNKACAVKSLTVANYPMVTFA